MVILIHYSSSWYWSPPKDRYYWNYWNNWKHCSTDCIFAFCRTLFVMVIASVSFIINYPCYVGQNFVLYLFYNGFHFLIIANLGCFCDSCCNLLNVFQAFGAKHCFLRTVCPKQSWSLGARNRVYRLWFAWYCWIAQHLPKSQYPDPKVYSQARRNWCEYDILFCYLLLLVALYLSVMAHKTVYCGVVLSSRKVWICRMKI